MGTALAVWALCALAKCRLNRSSFREEKFLRGHVRLTALWNEGGAFGLFRLGGRGLAALSVGALTLAASLWRRSPPGCGLLLGGGLSNLAERVRRGRVYDYVQFPKAPGRWKRFVFNLADFAIFLGGLTLALGRGDRRKPSGKNAGTR